MQIINELISIVAKVSPSLGNAIGGPAGAFVMSVLSKMFDVDENDAGKLVEAINNDPDYAIKLKKIETDHIQNIKNIELQRYQLEISDRDSARKNSLQTHDWVVPIISIGFSTLFAGLAMLDALSLVPIKESVLTNLFSVVMIIVNFYLGSSHGERRAQNKSK